MPETRKQELAVAATHQYGMIVNTQLLLIHLKRLDIKNFRGTKSQARELVAPIRERMRVLEQLEKLLIKYL